MKIGDALKEERLKRKLSQQNFCKGIITQASYSKIENNIHQILAKDLFGLLLKNDISTEYFVDKLDNNYRYLENNTKKINYEFEILNAFYAQDKEKVKKLNEKIQQSNSSKELKLTARIIELVLLGKVEKISETDLQNYKRFIFEQENWTKNSDALRLFSNSMFIFEQTDLEIFMEELIRKLSWKFNRKSIYREVIIVSIFVNYIDLSYRRKIKTKLLKKIFCLIDKLPQWPEFFVYRLVTNYYKALFKHEKKRAKELKIILKENGLEKFVKNLPK